MKKFGKPIVALLILATIITGTLLTTTACARRHHTVHYHAGHHGATMHTERIRTGEHLRKPANPTRDGYEFVNWYTHQHGGEVYNFNRPINSNTHLYARWNNRSGNLSNQQQILNNAQNQHQNQYPMGHNTNNYNNTQRSNYGNAYRNNACRYRDCPPSMDRINRLDGRIDRLDDSIDADASYTSKQDRMTRKNTQIGQDNRSADYSRANSNRGKDRMRQPDSFEGAQNPNTRAPSQYPSPLPNPAPRTI